MEPSQLPTNRSSTRQLSWINPGDAMETTAGLPPTSLLFDSSGAVNFHRFLPAYQHLLYQFPAITDNHLNFFSYHATTLQQLSAAAASAAGLHNQTALESGSGVFNASLHQRPSSLSDEPALKHSEEKAKKLPIAGYSVADLLAGNMKSSNRSTSPVPSSGITSSRCF